jgi:hypothetical protein
MAKEWTCTGTITRKIVVEADSKDDAQNDAGKYIASELQEELQNQMNINRVAKKMNVDCKLI